MEAHQAAIIEIPEQSDRTGSSGYQVPNQAMLDFKNFDYAAITIAASNYSTVFAKVNLPCIAYVSKTKLRPRSGMQSLLHKTTVSPGALTCIPQYLHQCRIDDHKLMPVTGEAERFYRKLASPALVGIEAVQHLITPKLLHQPPRERKSA
jgi:hypothetical protein